MHFCFPSNASNTLSICPENKKHSLQIAGTYILELVGLAHQRQPIDGASKSMAAKAQADTQIRTRAIVRFVIKESSSKEEMTINERENNWTAVYVVQNAAPGMKLLNLSSHFSMKVINRLKKAENTHFMLENTSFAKVCIRIRCISYAFELSISMSINTLESYHFGSHFQHHRGCIQFVLRRDHRRLFFENQLFLQICLFKLLCQSIELDCN